MGVFRPMHSVNKASTLTLLKSAFLTTGYRLPATGRLLYLRRQVIDLFVEIAALLAHLFDFFDRVNHRRVMFAAETAADLRQRRVRQRFAEIHRHLPRHRD